MRLAVAPALREGIRLAAGTALDRAIVASALTPVAIELGGLAPAEPGPLAVACLGTCGWIYAGLRLLASAAGVRAEASACPSSGDTP